MIIIMYQQILENAGLRTKEALLYDLLLAKGAQPVKVLIIESQLKRGIVYKVLYELENKRLITKFTKNKRIWFKPEHPYKLAEIVETKYKESQNQQLNISTYLPQLISAFKTTQNQPGVKVFEGVEGIKEVYLDTLKEKQEIWAILQTSDVDDSVYKWLNNSYAKERVKSNIYAKVIVGVGKDTKTYVERNEKELRETRLVKQLDFPIGIEMDIYGDKIAFMSFKKKTDLMGIIIHNALIAQTMRALFSLAWQQAAVS